MRSVKLALAAGLGHPTLSVPGARTWVSGKRDGRRIENSGRKVLPNLTRLGLDPGMRCIDYGCGSLRVGRHLIELLPPGKYIGLDIVPDFQDAGLARMDPRLVDKKRPTLALIADWTDERCEALPHDFLFANAVVQHVRPDRIGAFLSDIARLTRPGTRSCILFVSAPKTRMIGTFSWAHSGSALNEAAMLVDPLLDTELVQLNDGNEDRRGRSRMALVLRRPT